LPGPGEFYASPALAKLLAATPAAQLGDRFPGTQVGIIGSEALPSPDSLVIIIGRDVADLAQQDGAQQVTWISTTSPSECPSGGCAPVGTNANGMTLVLSAVAAGLLFPVLIFIGGATRLSAARREQRFAAMRLVGATPGQVSKLAVVESSVAAVAGTVLGFGLFYALRPAIATIPFSGERFFTSDLSLSPANVLLVAIGIPAAGALAARIALRRVNISPLGVTRRVTPRPPRAGRLIPLLAGIAWLGYLAYFSDIGEPHRHSSTTQAYAYLLGVFLILIGLIVAGPWLTMLGSRLTARRAKRPAGLIAARRLGDNPQTAFRAISGVVLAVFLASCAVGTITTIVAYHRGAAGDTANSTGTLAHQMTFDPLSGAPPAAIADSATNELTSIPGVEGVTAIHVDSTPDSASPFSPSGPIQTGPPVDPSDVQGETGPEPQFFVSCAEIANTPALGRCPDGADTVTVLPQQLFGGAVTERSGPMSDTIWPAADVSAAELSNLPVHMIVVGTDGSAAAVEQARTVLEDLYPPTNGWPDTLTLSEADAEVTKRISRYQQLANVVLFTSLPIAGCSLAVSIAGGLAERRRPFSLLRLTGVPLVMLRRVVALEAAVPLLLGVAVSACAGFAAAALFLRTQLDETLQPPSPTYYLLIAAGVIASLAIIATTNPLLARTTGPDTARNE
jgi:FtsX-like permease family